MHGCSFMNLFPYWGQNTAVISRPVLLAVAYFKLVLLNCFLQDPPMEKETILRPPLAINKNIIYQN